MKSTLEISAARLRANFAAAQAVAGPAFEVLAVIKADAYGHGAALCAPVLVEAGARWLGVADVEEGVLVRRSLAAAGLAGRETRLLAMCGFQPGDAPEMVAAGLTPVVWTSEQVEALRRAATAAGLAVPVHVELDTGMARQGTRVEDGGFARVLEQLGGPVTIEGVFSHLGCAEVVRGGQTAAQAEALEGIWTPLGRSGCGGLRSLRYLHLANTSGVDEGSTLRGVRQRAEQHGVRPMVRTGLALYGYALPLEGQGRGEREEERREDQGRTCVGALRPRLQSVARWMTRVVDVREIEAGATVGYGASFVARAPMRLALLPVGYADGFRREASSGLGDGWVMLGGQKAPVVGRVSMNLTVVDVTGFRPPVGVGDEVVLLGEGVSAEDHARWCGTIPYEILCGMRGRRRLV